VAGGGPAIGAVRCGLGAALVRGALAAGWAAALVLQAASRTTDIPAIST
jgi:hypothetical protein